MPGKSGHGRGKHSSRSRNKKIRRDPLVTDTQQRAIAQASKPASRHEISTPSVSTPTSMPTPTATRHPYIVTELRRIGILAGIILAILIVLAFVLS